MREESLIRLLREAVSPYQCVEAVMRRLFDHGFEQIRYEDAWSLARGGRYVVNHHDTTVFAFTVGSRYRPGGMLRMAAAHTDYPCLRIKPNADFVTNGYAQVNVEVYGGPILNTWFDRPLGVAGRVAVRGENPFAPKLLLYRSDRPVMIIPNLAIHMNRDVNKGVEINNQVDLMPVLDMLPGEGHTDYFLSFLSQELGVAKEDILDFELNTYCMEEPQLVGPQRTLLSAPRLDNQTSVEALVSAVTEGVRDDGINLIALFDHEEIGSASKQGAASILLHDMAKRLFGALGCGAEEADRSLYASMLLSVDVAHALHPNHKEKMDITNQPTPGKGFCIKEACSQSYASDAEAIAILRQICDKNGICYQRFVNRSDVRGGGTLGSIASTLLPVRTVDIGVPILSMHSVRELMGTADIDALCDCVLAYFQTA